MYMELTTFYYNNAPFILIGVGAAIVIVGLLGCFCTVKAYKAPLIMVSSTCISISMVISNKLSFCVSIFKNQPTQC